VQASDDFTLTIDLENPVGYFLQSICNVMPVPRHAVEAYGGGWADAAHIVTNGAFLVDEWRAGECLTLVRNPSFGGRFSGNLQRVEIRMSPGREHVMFRERYEAGEDDLYCPQLPAEEDRARYLYPGEYIISPLAMTSFILFDGGQPPFDDLRVRRAFAHSLDRVTYANVVLGGYLPLATGGIVPPGLPGHLPRIALSHEPERARQLLAEAGYPGGCGFPEVSLAEMGSWEYRRATQYLQGQWRAALGVNVVVEPRAFDEPYPKPRATAAQVLLTGWIADYPDPDSMLGMGLRWHMDTRRHPAVHRLIESARQAMNQRDRIALYQKADRLLIEEAVVVPLVYGRNSFFLKPWVRRFPASAVWSDFWKDIIIAPH
jgi:oligopeptide transport system substrate-binding protein